MSVAYFDCFAGISGDMVLGALVDAGADVSRLAATVEALGLDGEAGVEVRREHRGHVGGARVVVTTDKRQPRGIADLRSLVDTANVPPAVKKRSLLAINLIASTEAKLHDVSEGELHLHELGGADTVIDLVGAFWLLEAIGVGGVYASALPAPRGRAGAMPLPAPASVRLLAGTGAVFESSDSQHELVTPTGAAILAVAAEFRRPAMTLSSIGYGIGARETPGNALAVWVGDLAPAAADVTVIETNIDDMAPSLLAALAEDLMAAGALDVSITPTLMKKGRPGHVISVMVSRDRVAGLSDMLLRDSTTLGLRISTVQRVLAGRRIIEVHTAIGAAHAKVKEMAGKPVSVAPEYEDCRRLAADNNITLAEAMRIVTESARREVGLD